MLEVGDIQKCIKYSQIPTAIAIGKFGIFHQGHEKILTKLKEISENPILFSFTPSPVLFFSKNKTAHGSILSIRQRGEILKRLGIKSFFQKFTQDFSNLSPEYFIQLLVERFKMKHLIVGEDFVFGKNRSGNVALLKALSQKYNFTIHIIALALEKSEVIKTTNLRTLLQDGKIKEFNESLPFNLKYEITGNVAKGKQIAGKILGFKTANIFLNSRLVIPKFGVYACKIRIGEKDFFGIVNLGIKPTLNENFSPMAEAHIFDFNEEIYGKKITIKLQEFIREERQFPNLTDLKKQIQQDCLLAVERFKL
jgi:riboflavin kinase/FMN adenylyltransferase